MDEQEWLNTTHAGTLQRAASHLVSERKLRLLACAYARHLLQFDPNPDCCGFVELGEQIADGLATLETIESAHALHGALGYMNGIIERGLQGVNGYILAAAHTTLAARADGAARWACMHLIDYEAEELGVENPQCGVSLLREIFGNPFRPVDFAPWRTDTAVSLARQMYEAREFGAMPILADALQDAGCDNDEVLAHCRGKQEGVPGEPAGGSPVPTAPHVRGCWVVDGVLGLS